jgi:hypothetical protein
VEERKWKKGNGGEEVEGKVRRKEKKREGGVEGTRKEEGECLKFRRFRRGREGRRKVFEGLGKGREE